MRPQIYNDFQETVLLDVKRNQTFGLDKFLSFLKCKFNCTKKELKICFSLQVQHYAGGESIHCESIGRIQKESTLSHGGFLLIKLKRIADGIVLSRLTPQSENCTQNRPKAQQIVDMPVSKMQRSNNLG